MGRDGDSSTVQWYGDDSGNTGDRGCSGDSDRGCSGGDNGWEGGGATDSGTTVTVMEM
jgi:hypothetical protein